MKEPVSIKLLSTLARGKTKLGKEPLARVTDFVNSQRLADGGFMGKSGKPDIYYTLFGWMLSYVLGIKPDHQKMSDYLKGQDERRMDLIHYAAYKRCQMISQLAGGDKARLLLNALRAMPVRRLEDFKGLSHNDPESPYTQFVWLSLLEDSGNRIPGKEEVLLSLKHYRIEGGGFSNIRNGLSASTNATTAALSVIGQLDKYGNGADIDYLWETQKESGGFGATENSPLPDLLSTATALFTLRCYNRKPKVSPADFIEAHWHDHGGFSATIMEDCSDVEYTFYGLLALGTI